MIENAPLNCVVGIAHVSVRTEASGYQTALHWLKARHEGTTMIAVIFEVIPQTGKRDDYFSHAAALKSTLETMPGFISVERFERVTAPGKFLSLSFWEDEAAVANWRAQEKHRAAQTAGRETVFDDYRLRVAHVVRDYGMNERAQAPQDSQHIHSAKKS